MTTLYNCPKCGTVMEPPNAQLIPTREELADKLKRLTIEHNEAMRLLDESRVALQRHIADAQRGSYVDAFSMNKVVTIFSSNCSPEVTALFATLSNGTLWTTSVPSYVSDGSGGVAQYAVKWRRIVNNVDKEANA